VKFNPTSTLLVSGSADNTIRVITVPNSVEKSSCTSSPEPLDGVLTARTAWALVILILLTFLIALLAFAAQQNAAKL
jgi:prolactin regulatory element-binding protein